MTETETETQPDLPQTPTDQAGGGSSENSWFQRGSLLLFGAIASLFLLTFQDYGYSWDEVWQNRWYGQAVLRFISSFGVDQSALHTHNFYLYGGLFDALAELLPAISPLDGFGARRFANASMGMLALVGAWRLARLLAGPQAGFWALLFLIITPVWYGHIFINAKDIPFAAGYIWSLYFILKIIQSLPEISWKTAAGLGLAFGLSVGIRVGGVLVIIYFFMVIGLYLAGLLIDAKSPHSMKTIRRGILYKIPLSLAIAWILMAAFWPAVLLYPLSALVEAFQATSHFKWSGSVLYNGQYVTATELPWHYLPAYFGIKLPIPVLVAFVVGLIWAVVRTVQAARNKAWQDLAGPGLLLFATLFPSIYAIAVGSTLYDGIRHFLFIIPPMACLSGMALVDLLPRFNRRFSQSSLLLFSTLGVYLVFHLWTMIQLHPYQYAYINKLGGGMPAGAERFETDYWITSYRDATLSMVEYAKKYAQREGVPFEKRRFDVAVFGNVHNVMVWVPKNFVVINLKQAKRADFYIGTSRLRYDKKLPKWPVIERIERLGMTFAVVKTSLPPLAGENR